MHAAKLRLAGAIVGVLLCPAVSQATLISGFEDGFAGWEFVGDVSVQNSGLGIDPTEGTQFAWLTTLCDVRTSTGCNTTGFDTPYSGTSSIKAFDGTPAPPGPSAAEFLGLTRLTFVATTPPVPFLSVAGESGALKIKFHAPAASVLSFNWNHVTEDAADMSYFTVWTDEAASWRFTDYLYEFSASAGNSGPSSVPLCDRTVNDSGATYCSLGVQVSETDWQIRSLVLETEGWYWLGFGLGEVSEGTRASALAIDNVRLNVSEPGMMVLMSAGCIGLALAWSRRRIWNGEKVRSGGRLSRGRWTGVSGQRTVP